MNFPSFEKFNYGLRPAKNIERKMMCETLARLSRIAPLRSYQYIGFGAVAFHDFVLFHQRLGIHRMTSVESFTEAQRRIEFNRPYSCIKIRWGVSYDVIPKLKWNQRVIVWLDYDRPLESRMLGDITILTSSVKSGSVVIVTVDADPGRVEADENTPEKRLEVLRSRVGRSKIRASVKGSDLAKWGLAEVSRNVIHDHIEKTLSDRNAPLGPDVRLGYHQLFNFHYADNARMVTVGGLITDPNDEERLNKSHFKDLDFIRTEGVEGAYRIESPILTLREIRYLDGRLPRMSRSARHPRWLPEEERKKYAKVYRYFPAFSEVEP
ncbi:MAG TPA: O-methyltransferase [Candidatus Acidoferrum sp.]|jgi:hypothetical protein|nr:O-methyltransferase [Candidatus Acidoferrum sp.]